MLQRASGGRSWRESRTWQPGLKTGRVGSASDNLISAPPAVATRSRKIAWMRFTSAHPSSAPATSARRKRASRPGYDRRQSEISRHRQRRLNRCAFARRCNFSKTLPSAGESLRSCFLAEISANAAGYRGHGWGHPCYAAVMYCTSPAAGTNPASAPARSKREMASRPRGP